LEWLGEREREREKRGRRGRKRKRAKKREEEERKGICPSGMDVAPELTELFSNLQSPVLAGYHLPATTGPGRLSKIINK
jgi:hypothetical protein